MSSPKRPVPSAPVMSPSGLTRRQFLGTAAAGASATLFAGPGASAWAAPAGVTAALPGPASPASGDGILVLLTLYGGNDGLNMVVPYADTAYQAGRGELAVRPEQVLRLDDMFGLHPAMSGLRAMWDRGRVAIVRGVGYPNPNRSHFRSMDIWQTATPEAYVPTGWLGRWLDATGADPLRMVNIGSSLPRAMAATKGSGAALNPGRIGLPGGSAIETVFAELNRPGAGADLGPLGTRIAASGSDLLKVNRSFGPILKGGAAVVGGSSNLEGGAVAAGNQDGAGGLSRDLGEVSTLVRAGVPTRVFGVSLGGFDTHAAQNDQHARLMGVLDAALTSFFGGLESHPQGQRVTVVVYSEFGRRVAANASIGTDHGTAAPVLVIGPQVKGGFHGDAPSLVDLDQGDLKFSVDFRSVYRAVLESVLGIDAAAVLGRAVAPVALF